MSFLRKKGIFSVVGNFEKHAIAYFRRAEREEGIKEKKGGVWEVQEGIKEKGGC